MQAFNIIFIGTGSGKTDIKKNHSSFLIKTESSGLLIDAGDGISKALKNHNIAYDSIDSVVITHHHADHFTGIASLVTQMKLVKRTKPLSIFTHKNLTASVESLLNSVYMFKEILGFDLTIAGFEFGKKVSINSIHFTAKQNSHVLRKEILNKYPPEIFVSSSFLFEVNGKNIIYTSDIGSKDDLYLFKGRMINCLITESTHITFEDIYEAISQLKPKKLLITHIDDEIELNLEKWHGNLPENEKDNIIICYDGLNFEVLD